MKRFLHTLLLLPICIGGDGVPVHVLLVVEPVEPLPRLHEGELSAEGDLLPLGSGPMGATSVQGRSRGPVQTGTAPARVEH